MTSHPEPVDVKVADFSKALVLVDYEDAGFPIVQFQGRRVHLDNVLKYAADLIDRLQADNERMVKLLSGETTAVLRRVEP